MNPFEKKKHLKEAIVGYVSAVMYRLNLKYISKVISAFLEKRIKKSMRSYAKSFTAMSDEQRAIALAFFTQVGQYDVSEVFPLNLLSLESRVRQVFEQYSIQLEFLSDYNMGVIEFAYFIIELADRIKSRQKKDSGEDRVLEDQDIIEQEAKKLLLSRYAELDLSIIPIIVERFSSIALIFEISVTFRSVLQLNLADSRDDTQDEIFFQHSSERKGVVCLRVKEIDKKSLSTAERPRVVN